MKKNILFTCIVLVALIACSPRTKKSEQESVKKEVVTENTLNAQEKGNGWQLLFDGKTTNGWKNFNEENISGWIVEDGCLVGQGLGGDIGGDIVSVKEYSNFILKWDWKLGPNGNSGIMYHVVENQKYKAPYETGPEYQLIEDDDFRNPDGSQYMLEDWQKTAADYAMYLPNEQKKVNLREWNSSMIKFTEAKAEYWLNGEKVLEFVPWSEDWNTRRNSGKWDDYPDYGYAKTGKLCLQDHGSKIWFKNVKIKEL
jgi:hypothetical protein